MECRSNSSKERQRIKPLCMKKVSRSVQLFSCLGTKHRHQQQQQLQLQQQKQQQQEQPQQQKQQQQLNPETTIAKQSLLVFQCRCKKVLRPRLLGSAAPAKGQEGHHGSKHSDAHKCGSGTAHRMS